MHDCMPASTKSIFRHGRLTPQRAACRAREQLAAEAAGQARRAAELETRLANMDTVLADARAQAAAAARCAGADAPPCSGRPARRA